MTGTTDTAGAPAALRALVVDDSQAMRRSLVYALRRIPHLACDEAEDGAAGLKALAAARYDLVLTDINMPLLDGLKLIAHVRGGGAGAHQRVPIVVITTESAEEDRARALSLGANAYLVKPVQAHQVLHTVQQLLGLP